jgi:fatty-acyl-CoA synthase
MHRIKLNNYFSQRVLFRRFASNLQSYDHGVCNKPLLGATIGSFFDQQVQKYGGNDALIVRHQNIKWTYQELSHRVSVFAKGLLCAGIGPGTHVAII